MTSKLFFILFALFFASDAFATVDRFRGMWRDNPATTMVIGFDLISGSNPVIYYDTEDKGRDYEQYRYLQEVDNVTQAKGMNNQFIRLRGLMPNTIYYFVIKDSENVSRKMSFRTMPDNPYERLSIIAGGDSRNHRAARRNANLMVAKLRPHLVMFGGDMTGGDNSDQWKKWFDDWQETIGKDGRIIPIIVTRGNHESSNESLKALFDVAAEKLYYGITIGGDLLRVYTLNTLISSGGDQMAWLHHDLKTNGVNCRWKMAQYHYAIRPHTTSKTERNDQLKNWATLFHKYKVNLVVESDIHVVKSTWPIRPSREAGSEQGFIRDDVNGTVYVGEGCWGAPLRRANDRKSWTRDTDSFNQFKWIVVDYDGIEVRTVKTDNAETVDYCTEDTRFSAPSGIEIWHPANGPVIYINQPESNVIASTETPVTTPVPDRTPIPQKEPVSKPETIKNVKKPVVEKPRVVTTAPAVKPVEKVVVSNFSANILDDEVVVKWTSFDEPKDVVYDVLRSEDGKAFVSISKVNGTQLKGENQYKIVDKIRHVGDRKYLAYRLGHNKKSGEYITAKKSTQERWKSFKKLMADKKTGLCKVKYTLESFGDVTINMIDVNDNEIVSNKYDNKKPGVYLQTIDMRTLPVGSYLVIIKTGKIVLNQYRVDKK